MKKVFAVLFVIILLLTGCKSNDIKNDINNDINNNKTTPVQSNTEKSELKIKGSYIERELQLPEEYDTYTSLQLTKKDGLPFLYVFSHDGSIKGYRMNNDEVWEEDTPEWLKSLAPPDGGMYQPKVFENKQGKQFLFYMFIKEDIYNAKLFCSKDGTDYEELFPEGWNEKKGEYQIPNTPANVDALNDGTLLAMFFPGDICFYDKDSYKLKKTISGDDEYSEFILSVDDETVFLGKIDGRKLEGIDTVNTKDYSKLTYPYQSEFTQYSETYFDINDKKEMALCDEEGIHVLEDGTSTWQTIVDGNMTSLSMKTMYTNGFIATSDSNYYILYSSQSGYSLMKYFYDENASAVPSNELNIYSIKDNPTLRQAAAMFRETHPDIKINFNIIMTDEEYSEADEAIINDYVRALNTELLAGNGPDILVLDDLPIDSYIEKGLLLDMSDIIQPMMDELYPNIMNNYITDGKIYYVPTRFMPNLLCARNSYADNLSTLEELSEYVVDNRDRTIFSKMTYEDFIDTFAPYITNKIKDEDGAISKGKLIDQLNILKSMGDIIGVVDQYTGDEKYENSEMNLAYGIEIALTQPMDFKYSMMIPIGMVDYVKGSYSIFENSYNPVCELGVNQAGKNTELAKEFISDVLSQDVQKEDLWDGFPVNKEAMELGLQEDLGEFSFATEVKKDDGSEEVHTFGALSEQQEQDLAERYGRISNRIVKNSPVILFLKDEIKEFLDGNLSTEAAADRIIERANIYLSE